MLTFKLTANDEFDQGIIFSQETNTIDGIYDIINKLKKVAKAYEVSESPYKPYHRADLPEYV